MARRLVILLVALAIVGLAGFWFLTAPRSLAASDLPDHKPDLANGAYMFIAGGCESCHAAKGAKGDEQLKLGGGQVLDTPFGTFHVPNISPDKEHGIGGWALLDFVNAMKFGVASGRRAPLPGLSLHLLSAHEDRGPHRPQGLSRHAAGGRQRGAAARATLPVQLPARPRPLAAALCRRQDVRARPARERGGQPRRLSRQGTGPLRRVPYASGTSSAAP